MITRALAVAAILPGLQMQAQAVELSGRYGFIGEWEVSASLSERASMPGRRELSGRLEMRHTAICGPGEKPQKSGEISLSLPKTGRRFSARLDLDGATCQFAGELSEEQVSFIACSGQEAIPLRLWLKDNRLTAR